MDYSNTYPSCWNRCRLLAITRPIDKFNKSYFLSANAAKFPPTDLEKNWGNKNLVLQKDSENGMHGGMLNSRETKVMMEIVTG